MALGLLLAFLVAVLLKPMQAFAHHTANRLVPGIQATPDYLDRRKLTVYRAALEGAHEDGEVTSKERSILRNLSGQLRIEEREASQLERLFGASRTEDLPS